MDDQDWNLVILSHLKKKPEFAEAAQVFGRLLDRTRDDDEDMTLQQRLECSKGVVENLSSYLGNFYVRDDPGFSVEAFEKLVRWVDNSLDIYRVRSEAHARTATSCNAPCRK